MGHGKADIARRKPVIAVNRNVLIEQRDGLHWNLRIKRATICEFIQKVGYSDPYYHMRVGGPIIRQSHKYPLLH